MKTLKIEIHQVTYQCLNRFAVGDDVSCSTFAFGMKEIFIFGENRFYANDETNKNICKLKQVQHQEFDGFA